MKILNIYVLFIHLIPVNQVFTPNPLIVARTGTGLFSPVATRSGLLVDRGWLPQL